MTDLTWVQTYSGRAFTPLDPKTVDLDIEDIAHSLSLQCRFNGHCREFYSVAQHSVLVAHELAWWATTQNYSEEEARLLELGGLLHDATEAYVGDLVRPIKNRVPDFVIIEERIAETVAEHFGLPHPAPGQIAAADVMLLATEARDLMATPPQSWALPAWALPLPDRIVPWSAATAREQFLSEFARLSIQG